MKLRALILGIVGVMGAAVGQEERTFEFEAELEAVLDWQNPLAVTEAKLAEVWEREGFESSPIYAVSEVRGPEEVVGRLIQIGEKPYRNIGVALSAMGGKLLVKEGHFLLAENPAHNEIELTFTERAVAVEMLEALWREHPRKVLEVSTEAVGRVSFTTWQLDGVAAVLTQSAKTLPILRIAVAERADTLAILAMEAGLILSADLDFLLRGEATWALTAAALERRFAVMGVKEQVFFQWLDAGRTRARFNRKPFSNVTAALSLFGGLVQVQEANLDFENGVLSRATVSVYNRGDSGALTVPEFEKVIQATGRGLGGVLAVSPKAQTQPANAVLKSIGWMWTAPGAVALMEHNDISGKGAKGASHQPEFLRVKLAPPQNRDWSMGVTAVGATSSTVTKASLVKKVQRTAEGVVSIVGIPMVDQGDKGYCVVASCQRLFEFYQIPCDQHQLAQLVGTTADGGTSSRLMEAGLNKIDSSFKTRFRALISPGMAARDRQRLDEERFFKMVQTSINEGIPLLWTLQLGRAVEDPPLPMSGQVSGGHMRLIIGYDDKARMVLFTDSWGAGHELKRMSLAGAYASTDGLYTLTPRSY
jgi:hypothetical protein